MARTKGSKNGKITAKKKGKMVVTAESGVKVIDGFTIGTVEDKTEQEILKEFLPGDKDIIGFEEESKFENDEKESKLENCRLLSRLFDAGDIVKNMAGFELKIKSFFVSKGVNCYRVEPKDECKTPYAHFYAQSQLTLVKHNAIEREKETIEEQKRKKTLDFNKNILNKTEQEIFNWLMNSGIYINSYHPLKGKIIQLISDNYDTCNKFAEYKPFWDNMDLIKQSLDRVGLKLDMGWVMARKQDYAILNNKINKPNEPENNSKFNFKYQLGERVILNNTLNRVEGKINTRNYSSKHNDIIYDIVKDDGTIILSRCESKDIKGRT
jgi:hypothetical protein